MKLIQSCLTVALSHRRYLFKELLFKETLAVSDAQRPATYFAPLLRWERGCISRLRAPLLEGAQPAIRLSRIGCRKHQGGAARVYVL